MMAWDDGRIDNNVPSGWRPRPNVMFYCVCFATFGGSRRQPASRCHLFVPMLFFQYPATVVPSVGGLVLFVFGGNAAHDEEEDPEDDGGEADEDEDEGAYGVGEH